jgi:hypothetical protein
MKTYKLKRDNKKLIILQIEWLCEMNGTQLDTEDIKELYGKEKVDLIKIWLDNYTKVQDFGNVKWIQIYQ